MNKEAKTAVGMNREILSGSKDINNVLSTSSVVSPLFHTHYTNMETELHGISNLIAEILTEREAVFPLGIENGEFRKIAIAASLTAEEIIEAVQSRFASGSVRYPYTTVHQYLSVFMFRKGQIGKIKLTGAEDKPRSCCKPRCRWYLVQK